MSWDDFDDSPSDPWDDDLYWLNQREADDYRYDFEDDVIDFEDDRRWFILSVDDWERFEALLDAPALDTPKLKRLLSEPTAIEFEDDVYEANGTVFMDDPDLEGD